MPSRPKDREDAESGLIFDGFASITDPLRAEVYDAVKTCQSAGIDIKMLTGDNIVTASAIARELNILDEEHIAVEASALESLSDEEFSDVLPKIRVIARSTPLLKMRVVKELESKGNVVAVTGDGINDAPALKNADVGIAMGISGTEVSKEASDIVLLNDSFSTIATTVKWGRGIYENFKRFIQFQLTVNVSSFIMVFASVIIGLFIDGFTSPFTALELLWINIIMDGPARADARIGADERQTHEKQAHGARREHRVRENAAAHRAQRRLRFRDMPYAAPFQLPRRARRE